MRLELNPALVSEFEERMTLHPDWMHPYRFGEKLITGNFKYQGVPNGLTFVNSRSSPENIAVMQRAYEAEKFTHRADFYRKLCEFIPERETSTALDIASATGQFSLALCENGFKRVISSEIRQAQVAQFGLHPVRLTPA
jgi:hypothetical protein